MSPVDAYLPFGLTIGSLLAYTIGAVTFASVLAAWSALIEHRPAAARIRAVAQRRLELQAQSAGSERRRQRAQLPPGLVPMLVRRLHRLQASQIEKIRGKLMRAGFRSREAVGIYAGIKLASPLLFGFDRPSCWCTVRMSARSPGLPATGTDRRRSVRLLRT